MSEPRCWIAENPYYPGTLDIMWQEPQYSDGEPMRIISFDGPDDLTEFVATQEREAGLYRGALDAWNRRTPLPASQDPGTRGEPE